MSKFSNVCSFTFYFLLNMMTYSIMISLNDNFFKDFSIYYHILLISNSIIAYLLLITTKNNPGQLLNNKYSIVNSTLTNDSIINNIEKNEFKDNQNESLIIYESCKYCNNEFLPLRTHHCSRCQKCIKSYDHHCGMIGGCIGENNHFKFILFLFFQSSALFIGIFGLLETLQMLLSNNKKKNSYYYLFFNFSTFILCSFYFCFISFSYLFSYD